MSTTSDVIAFDQVTASDHAAIALADHASELTVTTLLVGPTGPAGPPGERGLAGADGTPGAPGRDGADGVGVIIGPGRPDQPQSTGPTRAQVEAASIGSVFSSTDASGGVGAWVWVKTPAGWQVMAGDTGWRKIADLPKGFIKIRRTASTVLAAFDGYYGTAIIGGTDAEAGGHKPAWLIPDGFAPAMRTITPIYAASISTSVALNGYVCAFSYPDAPHLWIRDIHSRETASVVQASWQVSDPWPRALLGTPI